MSNDPSPLPSCPHRTPSNVDADSDGYIRSRFDCSHPRIIAGSNQQAVSVPMVACRECRYSQWSAIESVAGYRPDGPYSPTLIEFSERVGECDKCGQRDGNYCCLAGGACSLAEKLGRGSFVCPLDKFGRASGA